MLSTIAMVATVLCGASFLFFSCHMIMAERQGDGSKAAGCALVSLVFFLATVCAGLIWDTSSKDAQALRIRENAIRAVYTALAVDRVEGCNGVCERSEATLEHTETGRRIRILVPNTTVASDLLIVACEDGQCEFVTEFKH